MEKVYCSKCNKCLTSNKGESMVFLHFNFKIEKNIIHQDKDLLQNCLGKYSPDKDYDFCHECVLDMLLNKQNNFRRNNDKPKGDIGKCYVDR